MLIDEATVEIVHRIVIYLARCLSQQSLWRRVAGQILRSIFSSGRYDDACERWFLHYIRTSFMFIRLASERKRYLRRHLAWLSVMTESFSDVEWIRSSLIANAALAFCKSCRFLANFFRFKPASNQTWKADLDHFSTFSPFLKSMPFKPMTSKLIQFPSNNTVDIVTRRSPPEIGGLGLDPFFSEFLFFNHAQQPMDQLRIIHRLQDYRDSELERVDELERQATFCGIIPAQLGNTHRIKAIGLNAIARECEKALLLWERTRVQKLNSRFDVLFAALAANPALSVHAGFLMAETNRGRLARTSYIRLTRQQQAIRQCMTAFASQAPKVARGPGLTSHLRHVTPDCLPPSDFDAYVPEALGRLGLKEMLDATVIIVNSRCADSTLTTVSELARRALDAANITPWHYKWAVLFTAIVRVVFDESYVSGRSLLDESVTESADFCRKCETFARHSRETRSPSQGIRSKKSRRTGLAFVTNPIEIAKAIGGKIRRLSNLAFLTNPIDIANSIRIVLDRFAKKHGVVSPDDSITLLCWAIAIDPPVNIIAVAKFLSFWGSLLIWEGLPAAKDLFLEAVKRIDPTANFCETKPSAVDTKRKHS
jgi:hypothetical protein